MNVSRALKANGVENAAVCIVGSENGEEFLASLRAEGLTVRAVKAAGRIRENITLHEKEKAETRISFKGFAADEGLLAFRTDVLALILNVDSVHSSFLDESAVRALLLGRDVKEFRNGIMISPSQLRFIAVDSANPAFTAEGNVLFTKDMRRLVCYAPSRPEKEYRVPESVRVLGRYSFRFPSHLERLYLPRGIAVSDNALVFYEGREPEIEYY